MITAKRLETMTLEEVEVLKHETYRAFFQAASNDRVFYLANLENIIRREAEFTRGLKL